MATGELIIPEPPLALLDEKYLEYLPGSLMPITKPVTNATGKVRT